MRIARLLITALAVGVVVLDAARAAGDLSDDQFAVAAGHYDRQAWKLAVEEFQTFLDQYPDDRRVAQAIFFQGEAMVQLGKLADARNRFHQYLDREPEGRYIKAALFRAGEAAYLSENYPAAKSDLERFRAKYGDDRLNAFVLPYLGDIALVSGDAKTATQHFRDGLEKYPDGLRQDECRLGLAKSLERQHQLDEAERLYRELSGKSNSALGDAAQFRLGSLQFAAGKFDLALETFSTFGSRWPESLWLPNVRLGRGLALLKLNRPADAVKEFDEVLGNKKSGETLVQEAAFGKMHALLQRKDYASLDRDAAEFEKRHPHHPSLDDVRRMLARSLLERKEFTKAVAILEPMAKASLSSKEVAVGQQMHESRYLLAIGYEGLKRPEDALAVLLPMVDDSQGPWKADAQRMCGSILLGQKKYREAAKLLEAFLESKPAGDAAAQAMGELAICFSRLGQLDQAKKLFAELCEKYPKHAVIAPTMELLAEAAYDANDSTWSSELWTGLARDGQSAEYVLKGQLGLGWSLFKADKLKEAAAAFDEVLKKDPPAGMAAEAKFVRGRILERLGQDELALALFENVIAKYPNDTRYPEALFSAARLYDEKKEYGQAAEAYQKLVEKYPQFAERDAAVYRWAWTMHALKKPDEAHRLLDRLRKDFSQSRFAADASYRLAEDAIDAKEYDRAARLLDDVVNAKTGSGPVDPEILQIRDFAMFLRGRIAEERSDWTNMRKAYEDFLKAFPNSPRRQLAEFWIAESYYRQGDYATASKRLGELSDEIKEHRKPWMGMIPLRQAQILAKQKQWKDAYAIAAKIECAFPEFAQQYEVDYLLGRCLADQADFDGARKAYERVIHSTAGAKTETAAMAQWMIGETYFHQKNFEAAYREYLKVEILYAYPACQAIGLLQAGKCRERVGDSQEAVSLYQRLVKNYANTPYVPEAAERLKVLAAAQR